MQLWEKVGICVLVAIAVFVIALDVLVMFAPAPVNLLVRATT